MKRYCYLVTISLFLFSCSTSRKVIDDQQITFHFIQLNDVYEIAPIGGGSYGGMARVAHIADSIKAENPNTFLFMAGDFLNPSLLGNLKLNGEPIYGKQMVEVMNAMNFELVTFGNHEFDIGEEALQQRMNESSFYWTSANCFQQLEDGPQSFNFVRKGDTIRLPETYSIFLKDEDGTKAEVGLFSVTLPSNPRNFVYYSDVFLEAGSALNSLKMQGVDVVVGLTHLTFEEDLELARKFPEISLIMGGHEHHSIHKKEGNTTITKADANAKTIYIHTFTFHTTTKELQLNSVLFPIDEKTPEKPEIKKLVDKWNEILETEVKKVITDPEEIIYYANPPLDGTDSASRGVQTNLGTIITQAMAFSFDDSVDAALVNGGSIRLDDTLENKVTTFDIFRVLPFGGEVLKVELTGTLLKEVLDYGKAKRGEGAYLQRFNFQENTKGEWLLNDLLIEDTKIYTVAFSDFLLKGYDIPFLTPENKGVINVYTPSETEPAKDIRKAVIHYLKSIKK